MVNTAVAARAHDMLKDVDANITYGGEFRVEIDVWATSGSEFPLRSEARRLSLLLSVAGSFRVGETTPSAVSTRMSTSISATHATIAYTNADADKKDDSKSDNEHDSESADPVLDYSELEYACSVYAAKLIEALNKCGMVDMLGFRHSDVHRGIHHDPLLLRLKSRTNAAALSLAVRLLYERVVSMVGVEIRGTFMHVLHRRHATNSLPPYVCNVHKLDVRNLFVRVMKHNTDKSVQLSIHCAYRVNRSAKHIIQKVTRHWYVFGVSVPITSNSGTYVCIFVSWSHSVMLICIYARRTFWVPTVRPASKRPHRTSNQKEVASPSFHSDALRSHTSYHSALFTASFYSPRS